MTLIINEKEKEFEKSLTVSEMLVHESVKMPDMVTVQLNGEFINRAEFEKIELKENDKIDFMYFMGGGSFGF